MEHIVLWVHYNYFYFNIIFILIFCYLYYTNLNNSSNIIVNYNKTLKIIRKYQNNKYGY